MTWLDIVKLVGAVGLVLGAAYFGVERLVHRRRRNGSQ